MKPKQTQDKIEEMGTRDSKRCTLDIPHLRNDDGWDQLMEIRKKLGKGRKNKKNSVEILSEMRQ